MVFGVDAEFGLSEQWYEQAASSGPPQDEPAGSSDPSQIEHPWLGEHFDRFDGERYHTIIRAP